jgi:hypothetical protein
LGKVVFNPRKGEEEEEEEVLLGYFSGFLLGLKCV